VSRNRGFTLLEVLVAFVVLAIILALVLRLAATISRASGLSADYAMATLQAENILAEAQFAQELPAGTTAGVAAGQWHWQRRVTPYHETDRTFDTNPAWQLVRVDIDVNWNRGGRERNMSMSTLRLMRVR
jgi:general secretion pathway protein I